MNDNFKIPKVYLDLINQIFEIENKVNLLQESNSIQRNLTRIKEIIEKDLFKVSTGESEGLIFHNPINELYNETRTDCDASIAGTSTTNLVITEVIKPIIRFRKGGMNIIVQKAVVIVKAKQ